VLIGNLLKNNDTVSHPVIFDRYADLDMAGTSTGDVFDTAGGSVLAKESNGVALTSLGNPALVLNVGAEAFSNWSATGVSACTHTFSATPTVPGDYVAIVQHLTTIAPGATVNFRVGYRVL
jgi:hypothetical protein